MNINGIFSERGFKGFDCDEKTNFAKKFEVEKSYLPMGSYELETKIKRDRGEKTNMFDTIFYESEIEDMTEGTNTMTGSSIKDWAFNRLNAPNSITAIIAQEIYDNYIKTQYPLNDNVYYNTYFYPDGKIIGNGKKHVICRRNEKLSPKLSHG